MKIILITLISLLTSTLVAQNKYVEGTDEPQPVELKGRFIIEPYVGLPSSGWFQNKQLVKRSIQDSAYSKKSVTGLPIVLGLKLEYLFSNHVGLSLDANYQENGIKSTYFNAVYDYNTGSYKDTVRIFNEQKLRIMARFQAHFGTEKIDFYGGAGIGVGIVLNKKNASYINERPNIDDFGTFYIPIKFFDYGLKSAGIPLAVRGFFGARFMLSDNFGILTEIGIGSGSILNVGATIRL